MTKSREEVKDMKSKSTKISNKESKNTAMSLAPASDLLLQDGVSLQSGKTSEPAPSTPHEIIDVKALSERLDKATGYIRKEVGTVAKSFCRIGFKLWEIRENKLYLGQGFKNVYEYGESVLRLQKTSVASYIAVCERFSLSDKDGKPTCLLDSRYANYSYGQLSLMLSVPDEKLSEIEPDFTCKEIRELKKLVNSESGDKLEKESVTAPKNGGKSDNKPDKPKKSRRGYNDDFVDPLAPTELFNRVLKKEDVVIIIKMLRENIGREVSIYVESVSDESGDKSESA